MTIKISIRDVCGIKAADLELDGIGLLVGANGQGKSSALYGIGAAITGLLLPPDVTKKEAAILVHDGATAGAISVQHDGGLAQAVWPGAELKTEGTPLRASPIAAGIESLVDMTLLDRADQLGRYLEAAPTLAELTVELSKVGIKDAAIERIWKEIETSGWDAAFESMRLEGVAAKRDWEGVSKVKFGTSRAPQWTPEGYELRLQSAAEPDLVTKKDQAARALEEARVAAGISAERRNELTLRAAREPSAKTEFDAATVAVADARRALEEAKTDLDRNPEPAAEQRPDAHCPHCNGALQIQVGTDKETRRPVYKALGFVEQDAKGRKKLVDAHKAARETHGSKNADLAAPSNRLTAADRALRDAQEAAAELAKVAAPVAGAMSIADATLAHTRAAVDLDLWRLKAKADRFCAEVMFRIAAVTVLAPDGLRLTKMATAIGTFNTGFVAPICESAGWGTVEITPTMGLRFNGRSYLRCAASEQWRLRTTLQLAMAVMDRSEIVLIDGADILDSPGRNGLFGALLSTGLPALVGMTVSNAADAPDLRAAQIGSTWLIDQGTARPLEAAQ